VINQFAGRSQAGWRRVRTSFLPILQASIAAAFAYQIGLRVFNHERPFFAAVAAWMCLGWSFERDLRRVVEIAAGVTVGVALGDLVVRTIGQGWWQLSTVLVVSALIARFVGIGPLLTTQAGAQAIIIAGTPGLAGGPYGRAIDAATGAVVALAFAFLTPYRPVNSARQSSAEALTALATTSQQLAGGLASGNATDLERALIRVRKFEGKMMAAIADTRTARQRVKWTINRGQRDQLADLAEQDVLVERAMRSLRVLARRLQHDATDAPADQRRWFAAILDKYGIATNRFAAATHYGRTYEAVRADLAGLGQILEPPAEAAPSITTAVAVFKAVVVDTLQAAGASEAEARSSLAGYN
jgi:uncharacterized membrane protein YgaE (UPF0421/DUF939 family)